MTIIEVYMISNEYLFRLGLFIKYVRKIFRKSNISYLLIRTQMCFRGLEAFLSRKILGKY